MIHYYTCANILKKIIMSETIWFVSKIFGTYFLTVWWALYSFAFTLTVAVINLYGVSKIRSEMIFSSSMNYVSEVIYRWLNTIFLILITIEGFIYRKQFKCIKRALETSVIKSKTIVLKGIAGPIILWTSEWLYSKLSFFVVINTLGVFLPMIMIRLTIIQYAVLIKQLEKAFLKNKLNIKFTNNGIGKSIQQYDNLCTISLSINKIFATKLLLSITITFAHNVIYALLFIRRAGTLMNTPLRDSPLVIKLILMGPVVSLFLVVFQEGLIIISASISLMSEANDYLKTIDKLVIEDVHGDLAGKKMVRLLATYRRKVNITVLGLFTIDDGLLVEMFQSGLTYLIILLQFVQSFQCNII